MLDLNPCDGEKLFTTLAPEQAALIEGGSILQLIEIKCIAVGEDTINQPSLFVDGMEVWSKEVAPGEETKINQVINFFGSAKIELYNQNCCDKSDFIDSFTIPGAASAKKEKPLIGSESKKCYLTYVVFE